MSNVSHDQALDEAIQVVLKETKRDMSVEELRVAATERLQHEVDMHTVRESVWRLIAGKLAALTNKRTIRAR